MGPDHDERPDFTAQAGFGSAASRFGTASSPTRHPILSRPLTPARSLDDMRVRWRIGVVALMAVAVIGGLVPHAALWAAESAGAQMVQLAEAPVASPSSCTDVMCGKGSPAPASPSPAIAVAVVLGGLAALVMAASAVRRRRSQVVPLPAGARDPLFHPPQFS
jgi:hypothetical protein